MPSWSTCEVETTYIAEYGKMAHLSLAMIISPHHSWIFLVLWNHIKHMMTVY
jgi:hypothetical protein